MNQRFKQQVAVITGAANGIGAAVAKRIAEEQGIVYLLDNNEKLLTETVDRFKAAGYDASGIVADISDEQAVAAAFDRIEAAAGRVDIMVNAAGIVGPTNQKITEYPAADFKKIYRINLKGAFFVTRSALKIMEKHNYGRILLIASIAGKEGNPNMVGYSATKAAIIGMVKAVGKEYAQTGITVNGLAPAVISTPMNNDTSPQQLAYMTEKIPMKRLGTVDEVAAISSWIVSREASFNTGFIFDISGGRATY